MAWFDRNAEGKKGASEERLDVSTAVEPKIEPEEEMPLPPVKEMPLPSSREELVAQLDQGSKVNGQLTFNGAANIDGNVEGEILCHGLLTIGEKAEIKAKISGQVVVIRGRVEGDVEAEQKVELDSPARLSGNVRTPRLIVMEGVVFDGHCSMVGAREKGEVPSALRSSSERAFEGDVPKLFTEREK
ncbi:MAG: polymer-forming cytoskeletal protein [Deltaproteobacteria bacterium]|nr:polymer-forming cytoskeletal protein [Deltaproteobacteria bacterium]